MRNVNLSKIYRYDLQRSGYSLTMRNVNREMDCSAVGCKKCYSLTMRNVNLNKIVEKDKPISLFINYEECKSSLAMKVFQTNYRYSLTMRNVNLLK